MGTKLPLYGYIDPDATGIPSLEKVFRPLPNRQRQRAAVKQIFSYLSRQDVQSLAYGLIIDDFDESCGQWTKDIVYEQGGSKRTDLLQLLDKIAGRGTIVVPSVDDLIEHKSVNVTMALERIVEEKPTVLAIFHPESPLTLFAEENHRADARVFAAMADNVLSVRTRLQAVLNNRKRR